MSAAYRIQDEPGAGRAGALVFNPFWPLLGMMLAGAWLGVLMFAANAMTLRSQTRRREILLAALIPLGACALVLLIGLAVSYGQLPQQAVSYALLLVTAWKLALAYWIFFLQQNAFALYEYFSGGQDGRSLQLGAALAVGGMLIRPTVMKALPDTFWILVLG